MKPAVSLLVLSAAMVGAFHAAALSAAPIPAVPVAAASGAASHAPVACGRACLCDVGARALRAARAQLR
ncbi:hypothetical protein G3N96_38430, partial [Burkholderia sp. Se-20373]|uniref:hypothetical protein n=1 Tax=Burkholderia sp. Se-20373 TaxID=2703898 RepID=UPI00197DF1F7